MTARASKATLAITAAAVAADTRPKLRELPTKDAARDVATRAAKIARASSALLWWGIPGTLRRGLPQTLLLTVPPELPHWNSVPHRGPGVEHAGPIRSPGSRGPRVGSWMAAGSKSHNTLSMNTHHEFGIRRRAHQRRLHVYRPTDIRRAACPGRLRVCKHAQR